MWNKNGESEEIKANACKNVVIILEDWKRHVRRRKIYRACLVGALMLSISALTGVSYFQLDSKIPSVIHIRAGQTETFDLGVPAKAEFVSVSGQGDSNIPQGAVDINMNESFTLQAAMEDSYQLKVKLFGFLNFKNVDVHVIDDAELIPVGQPVGIYVETDGVMVIGTGEFKGADGSKYSPAKYALKSGDYIRKVNGECVSDKESFTELVEQCSGNTLQLTIEREGELMEVSVTPAPDSSGKYKLGLWIRDNAQGVGTMTYMDAEGNFGALGHGIADVDTSTLMHMDEGTLYQTDIVEIKKGTSGDPGEMTGMIIYSDERILGEITDNSEQGIFGVCNPKARELFTEEALPIGLKQEIQEGAAQILCTVDGTAKYYDVQITRIRLDNDNVNRGIELTVTDEELLAITGGIVQGMSGSPIIQNGKIIGAVTHVLVNNSARGYGIFIENMLKH